MKVSWSKKAGDAVVQTSIYMMKCRRHGLSKMLASGTALAVIWDN